ncbi:SpoIIE family protein phosphatase [Cellulomonas humilata]|uniref:SpoIIE family protein phosphatase n=1 Tax=Cellulomonas humilata TaxID=144055 RepID=A0A7Y6DWS0_9CELL|nr:SpoIIE family protein phosphatase [Cellulomonas humilata]NUU17751.1 SpoIIE family protein phosphatase [Cellulomonas humilata]
MAPDGYVDKDAVLSSFDASPGVQLVVRAPDLRIVAANRGAREAFQRGSLLDVSLRDLRDPGLQAVVAALIEAVHDGEPFRDEQVPVVADWSDPASGIWLDLTVTPWRDEHGTVQGAVAAGIDITTAVRAATLESTGAATADRRLARAREVVLRLQGALLPSTVPLLPRVDVAASYLVAGLEQAAGGDWFDSATLPDGRVSLTVGDVVGHGVEASAIMSQLRAVLAARLLEGAGILSALQAVEAYAGRVSGAFAATLCVALLDPHTGDLEYSTRGHPAPLVVGPEGARLLPTTGDGPLGSRTEGRVATANLRDGEAIILFTDGLVENTHRPLLDGLTVLERTAFDAYLDPAGGDSVASRICQVVPRVLTDDGFTDDVTVLAAHRRRAPEPLDLSMEADPRRLAQVRAAVDAWGLGVGLGSRDRAGLVLGVSEVMANAVEHAYRGSSSTGTVELHATIRDDAVIEVVVRDHGVWREPDRDPGERGRGFSMMASAGLQVDVVTGDDGTTVTLELPARRPAPVDQADAVADTARLSAEPLVIDSDPHVAHVVHVRGAVDHRAAAAQVEAEILRRSRNGLVPVTVDLGGVVHLGSAGVRVLESLLQTTDHLQVVAPPGTPAAQTLDVAGTPFRPTLP